MNIMHRYQPFRDCTKNMSDTAFGIYTQFFTNADSYCFYYRSEIWQEGTTKTINALQETSTVVAAQLETGIYYILYIYMYL